jgi:hypothetical protein
VLRVTVASDDLEEVGISPWVGSTLPTYFPFFCTLEEPSVW